MNAIVRCASFPRNVLQFGSSTGSVKLNGQSLTFLTAGPPSGFFQDGWLNIVGGSVTPLPNVFIAIDLGFESNSNMCKTMQQCNAL